jgi:hypothetical protein
VFESISSKCVNNVVWETLNRARFVIDEKLAWEGEVENEDDVFFMPPENPQRENPNYSVVSNIQAHLEVNSVVHVYVVKQLIYLNIVHFLGFPTP